MNGSDRLLEKADRYIRPARVLADDGDLDSAASRLYYAMFYIAEALLEARGLSFSSHHAVIAAYGQYFAKTEELDPLFHRALLTAFGPRQLGDYAFHSGLVREDIDDLATSAERLLKARKARLPAQGGLFSS